MRFADKTKQIMAFAMAFAMLLMPVAQAAGHCIGPCHTGGRSKAVGEAQVHTLHSHALHNHSAPSFLDPVSEAAVLNPVDSTTGWKARMASASCAMASFRRPLVALQGSYPEAMRGFRLLTVSVCLQTPEMEPSLHANGCFEAARAATAAR